MRIKPPTSYIERVLDGSEKGRDVGHTYSNLLGEVVEYRTGDRLIPPGPGEGNEDSVLEARPCRRKLLRGTGCALKSVLLPSAEERRLTRQVTDLGGLNFLGGLGCGPPAQIKRL
jgi:hypothetical protein